MVIGLVVVVAVLAGIKVGQVKTMIAAGEVLRSASEAVTTVKVEGTSWQAQRAAIGSLVAVHDVVLGAEAPGTVREVTFDSGKSVKRGAVMVRIDATNEEAQLACT